MTSRYLMLAVCCSLALGACTGGSTTGTGAPGAGKAAVKTVTDPSGRKVQVSSIRGIVVGPVGYKAGEGAPVPFATASGMTPGRYGLRQASATDDGAFKEEPIAGVQVYLASQKGERFKGPSVGTTNIKGEFVIENVPLELSFLVMTNTKDPEQRHKELCAPMQNIKTAADIKISYGSTIVLLNTLQTMTGNALGQLSASIYLQLTAAVDAKLSTMKLAQVPDISDPKQISTFMSTMTVGGKPATALVDDLRSSLQQNGVSANNVQQALDQLNISFSGSGSAAVGGQNVANGGTAGTITLPPDLASQIFGGGATTPAPAPTAEPTAAPTAEPTAAPTAGPTGAPTSAPSPAPTATPAP